MYMDDGLGYYKQCRSLPNGWVVCPRQNQAAVGLAPFGFVFGVQHDSRCWEKSNSPKVESHVEYKSSRGIRAAPSWMRALENSPVFVITWPRREIFLLSWVRCRQSLETYSCFFLFCWRLGLLAWISKGCCHQQAAILMTTEALLWMRDPYYLRKHVGRNVGMIAHETMWRIYTMVGTPQAVKKYKNQWDLHVEFKESQFLP